MKIIQNTAALIDGLCTLLGLSAYGAGEVTILPAKGGRTVSLLDGRQIITVSAVLSAGGFADRDSLLAALDDAAARARAYSANEGIMRIVPCSPAVLVTSSEKGYFRFEQAYEITYLGGAA